MKINELIKLASVGYTTVDLYEEVWNPKTKNSRTGSGDTLALFIVRELKDTFDAEASDEEQMREAIRRLEGARDDLAGVISQFKEKLGDG